jgi:hypothetical protein
MQNKAQKIKILSFILYFCELQFQSLWPHLTEGSYATVKRVIQHLLDAALIEAPSLF